MTKSSGTSRPHETSNVDEGSDSKSVSIARENQLLSMLDNLPPSKEVLEFYRAKVAAFEDEERQWMSRLSASRGLTKRVVKLEGRIEEKEREIRALQNALVEMQAALAQERKRNAKLQSENNRLKITENESRRKSLVLLEMTGRRESDIVRMINEVDKDNDPNFKSDIFVPDNLRQYIRDSKKYAKKGSFHRSTESLRIEIATLENQIVEQERCHMEQVSALENERRVLLRDQDSLRDQFKYKISELSEFVKNTDDQQNELHNELTKARTQFRRSERKWLAEKETLYRKLQFLQQFGANVPKNVDAAFFTDQRAAFRLGGEERLKRQIQKLNSELAEQKTLTETYRGQMLAMESEIDTLRDRSSNTREGLKKKIKSLTEQLETSKERYDDLERRKRNEIQGYQSDIKLLKQKVKQVEQQLVKCSVSKAKEHDYIKAIKAYDKELNDLKDSVKRSGVWLT